MQVPDVQHIGRTGELGQRRARVAWPESGIGGKRDHRDLVAMDAVGGFDLTRRERRVRHDRRRMPNAGAVEPASDGIDLVRVITRAPGVTDVMNGEDDGRNTDQRRCIRGRVKEIEPEATDRDRDAAHHPPHVGRQRASRSMSDHAWRQIAAARTDSDQRRLGRDAADGAHELSHVAPHTGSG